MTTDINFHIPAKFIIELDLASDFQIAWDKCESSLIEILEALSANTEFMRNSIATCLANKSDYVPLTRVVDSVTLDYKRARSRQNEALGLDEQYSNDDLKTLQTAILGFLASNTSATSKTHIYQASDSSFSAIKLRTA